MCGSEKVTLGHEFAGTVVSKGPMAGDKFSVGDQVGVDPNLPCHRCQFCVRGQVLTNHSSLFTLILTNHSALIILAAQFWCNICDLEEDVMENSLDDDETEETVLHQALKTSDTLDMLIKRL